MFPTKPKKDHLKQACQENIPSGGHKSTGEMGLLLYIGHLNTMSRSLGGPMSSSLLLIVFHFLTKLSFQMYFCLKCNLGHFPYRILASKWQEMCAELY